MCIVQINLTDFLVSESVRFEFENMSGHRINHSAVNQFPLTTISGVRDFEKQLKEGDSAVV